MRMRTMRLGLSLMVVVAFWASRAAAQEGIKAPGSEGIKAPGGEAIRAPQLSGAQSEYQMLVVPTVPYEPDLLPPMSMLLAQPAPPGTARHRLQVLMNQHGYGCEANAPWGACSSLHYEMHFIFGSCRDFFNERCDPNQGCGDKCRQR